MMCADPLRKPDPGLDRFLAALDHPHKPLIEALRQLMRELGPEVGEGVKWNAPSFHRGDWFATVHLRGRRGLPLILHFGARARPGFDARGRIEDPQQLLHWLAADRAQWVLVDTAQLQQQRQAVLDLLRQWLQLL